MARLYYTQIQAGNVTFTDVPEHWRDQVARLLGEYFEIGGKTYGEPPLE